MCPASVPPTSSQQKFKYTDPAPLFLDWGGSKAFVSPEISSGFPVTATCSSLLCLTFPSPQQSFLYHCPGVCSTATIQTQVQRPRAHKQEKSHFSSCPCFGPALVPIPSPLFPHRDPSQCPDTMPQPCSLSSNHKALRTWILWFTPLSPRPKSMYAKLFSCRLSSSCGTMPQDKGVYQHLPGRTR